MNRIILFFCLILTNQLCFSQLELDLRNGTANKSQLKNNQRVDIIATNFNPFAYGIDVSVKQIDFYLNPKGLNSGTFNKAQSFYGGSSVDDSTLISQARELLTEGKQFPKMLNSINALMFRQDLTHAVAITNIKSDWKQTILKTIKLHGLMEELGSKTLSEANNTIYQALKKDFDESIEGIELATLQIEARVAALSNLDNYTRHIQQVIPQKDELRVEVKLVPSQAIPTAYKANFSEQTKTFIIQLYGGFKIDLSAGIASLSPDNQVFGKVTDEVNSTAQIIQGNSDNDINPAAIGLVHLYPRWKKGTIKPAITFGIGTGVDDVDENAYGVGGSLVFGNYQRFIITSGVAFRKVDRLKETFQIGIDYSLSDLDLSEVTDNIYRSGLLVAISYDLIKK